jgi:hypothetical protein
VKRRLCCAKMEGRSLCDLEFLVGAVAIGDAELGPPSAGCISIGSVRFLAISVVYLMMEGSRGNIPNRLQWDCPAFPQHYIALQARKKGSERRAAWRRFGLMNCTGYG